MPRLGFANPFHTYPINQACELGLDQYNHVSSQCRSFLRGFVSVIVPIAKWFLMVTIDTINIKNDTKQILTHKSMSRALFINRWRT